MSHFLNVYCLIIDVTPINYPLHFSSLLSLIFERFYHASDVVMPSLISPHVNTAELNPFTESTCESFTS